MGVSCISHANSTVQPINIRKHSTNQLHLILWAKCFRPRQAHTPKTDSQWKSYHFPASFFSKYHREISDEKWCHHQKANIKQLQNKQKPNHVFDVWWSIQVCGHRRIRSIVPSLWNVIVNSLLSGGSIPFLRFSLNSGALWMWLRANGCLLTGGQHSNFSEGNQMFSKLSDYLVYENTWNIDPLNHR